VAGEALTVLRGALDRIAAAALTRNWIGTGVREGGFDHRPFGAVAASFAQGSRRRTANGEPLSRDEVLLFAEQLIDPVPPKPDRRGLGLRLDVPVDAA
jgi:hypothetical protein